MSFNHRDWGALLPVGVETVIMTAFAPFAGTGSPCQSNVMRITDLRTGEIYRLKGAEEGNLVAQVGEGGDVRFFRARSLAEVPITPLALRVVMNEPSFLRYWRKEGFMPIHDALSELARYADTDIGSDTKYSVRLDNIDDRTVIDDATFDALERLAVWETAHVLKRFGAA